MSIVHGNRMSYDFSYGNAMITSAVKGKYIIATMYGLTPYTRKIISEMFGNAVLRATIAYAKEHRNVVPYINEDPFLVCNLPLSLPSSVSMPIRVVTCGASKIPTGLHPTNSTILKATITFTSQTGNIHIGGSEGGDSSDWRLFLTGSTLYWDTGNKRATLSLNLNVKATIEAGDGYMIVNGTRKESASGTTISASNNITIARDAGLKIHGSLEIYDGVNWHVFAPIAYHDGNGLIDLYDLSLHFPEGADISFTLTNANGDIYIPPL